MQRSYREKVMFIYIAAYSMDLINTFIANVAFPSMAREFGVNMSTMSWVANAYVLSLTISMPLSAWLSGRYGTKNIFILSLSLFCAGTLFAGLSPSITLLIIARVVQGFGGGLLIPVGQTLLFREYEPHERALISARILIPTAIAPTIAPAIGGLLVQFFSWHELFLLNIPICLVILVATISVMQNKDILVSVPLDVKGLVLISLSIMGVLLLLERLLAHGSILYLIFLILFLPLIFLLCLIN